MVGLEYDHGPAVLTIDRPHARNAIALDTVDQREKALDAAGGYSAPVISGRRRPLAGRRPVLNRSANVGGAA